MLAVTDALEQMHGGRGRPGMGGIEFRVKIVATEDEHFLAGPHGPVRAHEHSWRGRIRDGQWSPTLCDRIETSATVKANIVRHHAGPNDHFGAGPCGQMCRT